MPARKLARRPGISRPRPRAGICRSCGCTASSPCRDRELGPGTCSWANAGRTFCTSCESEARVVRPIKDRPRTLSLGAFFAEVMPEGSFDEFSDRDFADQVVGEANGLRVAVAR